VPNAIVARALTAVSRHERSAIAAAVQASDAEVAALADAVRDYALRAQTACVELQRITTPDTLPEALRCAQQLAALSALAERRLVAAVERRRAVLEMASAVLESLPTLRSRRDR
jgi:hypothetical protein